MEMQGSNEYKNEDILNDDLVIEIENMGGLRKSKQVSSDKGGGKKKKKVRKAKMGSVKLASA